MQTKYRQPDLRDNIKVYRIAGVCPTLMFNTKNDRQGSYSAKGQGVNLLRQALKHTKLFHTQVVSHCIPLEKQIKSNPLCYKT